MRSSTASLILAFCAGMTVQAAPVASESITALINRDVEDIDMEMQEANLSKKRSVGGFLYHGTSTELKSRGDIEKRDNPTAAAAEDSDDTGSDTDSESDSDEENGATIKTRANTDASSAQYSSSNSLEANDPAKSFEADASDDPANSYDADANLYDADANSYDADADSYDADANSYDADADSYDADADSYDADADSYDADANPFDADADSYDADAANSYEADAANSYEADAANSFEADTTDSLNADAPINPVDATSPINAEVPTSSVDAAVPKGAPTDSLTAAVVPEDEGGSLPPKNGAEDLVQGDSGTDEKSSKAVGGPDAENSANLQANSQASIDSPETDANSEGDVIQKRDPGLRKKQRKFRKNLRKKGKKSKGKKGKKCKGKKCKRAPGFESF